MALWDCWRHEKDVSAAPCELIKVIDGEPVNQSQVLTEHQTKRIAYKSCVWGTLMEDLPINGQSLGKRLPPNIAKKPITVE